MKRYLIFIYFMLFGLSLGFAQSGKIIDDIYVTPNDAQMVNEVKTSKIAKERVSQDSESAVYRNGAREIVFIDQYGNRTTAISDTVYIVDGEMSADSVIYDNEEGYYLNEFNGSESDLEYAERIRRFHNPKYTITIADPGYNDIYFLDDDYWNVYVDGMYATVTPTWNNPYYWNYQWVPYSYSSWAWRANWGYPSWGSYYGWGGYPRHSGFGYGGWYDPWHSGYYGWGGGYGWGDYYGWGYPYYGGYYGWDYPYYGWGGGYYSSYNSSYDMGNRRGLNSSDRYTVSGLRSDPTRRSAVLSSTDGRSSVATRSSGYTRVASDRSSLQSGNRSGVNARSSTRNTGTRTAVAPSIDTRSRTGAVRSANDWNNMRDSRTYSTSGNTGVGRSSSTVINRTNPSTRSSSSSSVNSGRSSSTYNNSGTRSTSRSYESSRSSSNSYNTRSSGSYSSPSRSSSSGGSYGGGGSSSGGGGRSSSGSSGSRR